MKRYAMQDLVTWKHSLERKPLVLFGARQVGKTWLVREFGRTHYKHFIEIDFSADQEYRAFFQKDLDPYRIIRAIEAKTGKAIRPSDTLIFFDEVQECEQAKNSLKYFEDKANEYHIVAAGSYLGVSTGGSFPVGKVDMMTLYPMSFFEFLEAIGREQVLTTIQERDYQLLEALSSVVIDLLKTYFFVGGMPEAVNSFVKYNDLQKVRKVQNKLLANYTLDFSKHIPADVRAKVKMIWDSIPLHLGKEKKKFIYKELKEGARASEYENAMLTLEETGLVYKIFKTFTPKIPLISYYEQNIFKLYMLDIGLLAARANIDISLFYLPDNSIFNDFQGALAEQFVLQEIKQAYQYPIGYWGRKDFTAEVDFVLQYKNEVIPIEVKSAYNTQAKSLKIYMKKANPQYAVKLSLNNYAQNENLYSIPLYMVSMLEEFFEISKSEIKQR